MKTIRVSTFAIGPLGFALLLASAAAVQAESFYGLAGGLNYAGPTFHSPQDDAYYTRGFALQASVGRRFGDRLGARLDALVNQFAVTEPPLFVGVACARGSPCGRPAWSFGFTDPVGVAALTASALVNVDPPGAGFRMYLIAGGGAYYLYQHPSAEGAVRPGVSAGADFAAKVKGQSRIFVEARFHDVLGVPSQPAWVVPLTLGITF